MSHLSDVAEVSRKVIKYGSIGLVALIVLRMVFNAGRAWWKARNPDPPPPPDVKFGKLPPLTFPITEQPKLSYRLETRTGSLPVLDGQFTVYFMPIRKPSLLAYDQAAQIAQRLDFIQEPDKLSETQYRWNSTSPIPSSLTIDIITGEFILDRVWQQDPEYLTPSLFISEERAVEVAHNFLSRVELLPNDIREGTNSTSSLRVENGQLSPAVSISKAQFMQVNLFRAPVNGIGVVNPLANKGLISLIIAFQREEIKQLVRVEYSYFPVDLDQFASYPLIGVEAAWQRLHEGKSFIAAHGGSGNEVVIRDVYLAYYDSDTPQQFLQPVYVFTGDEGFLGYVPAVSDAWVE